MDVDGTVLEWGNSYGIRISKKDVLRLKLRSREKIKVQILHTQNPLRELFGLSRREGKKITHKDIREARKELDTKF